MDRSSRDKFTALTDQSDLAYGESACLETPPDLFKALDDEFHFDIDLAANEQNHLLPRWFGPGGMHEDALDASWSGIHNRARVAWGFCNPAYGTFAAKMMAKAVQEAEHGFTSVFLLPHRINRSFKQYVLGHANYRYVETRIVFWYQGKPKPTWNKRKQTWELTGALFDSIIAIFEPPSRRKLVRPTIWHWDPKIRTEIEKRYGVQSGDAPGEGAGNIYRSLVADADADEGGADDPGE